MDTAALRWSLEDIRVAIQHARTGQWPTEGRYYDEACVVTTELRRRGEPTR